MEPICCWQSGPIYHNSVLTLNNFNEEFPDIDTTHFSNDMRSQKNKINHNKNSPLIRESCFQYIMVNVKRVDHHLFRLSFFVPLIFKAIQELRIKESYYLRCSLYLFGSIWVNCMWYTHISPLVIQKTTHIEAYPKTTTGTHMPRSILHTHLNPSPRITECFAHLAKWSTLGQYG